MNAISKNGTNDFHGSAFHYFRNQTYGADTAAVRGQPFNRSQSGFSLGGPILRDKLHFFTANEWTSENTPVAGPYSDQPTSAAQKFPLQADTLARFLALMKQLGSSDIGTAVGINIPNPLTNLFARLDYQVNGVHRLVLRFNYSDGERLRQQTARTVTTAVLSDNFHNFKNVKSAPVMQLFSNFASGASNELFVGYNNWFNRRDPLSTFPQIRVNTVQGVNSATTAILAGADQFSQGNQLDTKTWGSPRTTPSGRWVITPSPWARVTSASGCGTCSRRARTACGASATSTAWPQGTPTPSARRSSSGKAETSTSPACRTRSTRRTSGPHRLAWPLRLGMRFDMSSSLEGHPYNAADRFRLRTSHRRHPSTRSSISPRIGFNWDATGDRRNQVRGGVGLFVGTPPYVWLENAYVNSGNIITFLNCNTNGSTAPAPAFRSIPRRSTPAATARAPSRSAT